MKIENSIAEKKDMITMFRAVINMNNKEVIFAKSSTTISGLNKLLNEHGMNIQNVKRIETFLMREEKQRGRGKRKY